MMLDPLDRAIQALISMMFADCQHDCEHHDLTAIHSYLRRRISR